MDYYLYELFPTSLRHKWSIYRKEAILDTCSAMNSIQLSNTTLSKIALVFRFFAVGQSLKMTLGKKSKSMKKGFHIFGPMPQYNIYWKPLILVPNETEKTMHQYENIV